jgi:hypothetical protein
MTMTDRQTRKRRQRGSTLALVTVALPFLLIPVMGLAIDCSMLFIIQAKLSLAVDGAALGAGRLLGTNANTNEIAGEFLRANFPSGWWGTRNLTPAISSTHALGTYVINVNATVEAPLLFLRIFGQQWSTIAARAVATRGESRVMLVLDRSASMNTTDPVSGRNVFNSMQSAAKSFVGMFSPGSDQLGLVVYSGSAIVAYPTTRPWDPSPASSGGPDGAFGTSSTTGVMINQINTMRSGGYTNISEALSIAYIELQKAHNRAIANTGLDNAMNAIVLFTDGAPTAFSASPNDNSNLPNSSVIRSGSPCTYKVATSDANKMRGWIQVAGTLPATGFGTPNALYRLAAFDTTQTLTYWLQNGDADMVISNPSAAVRYCNAMGYLNNFGTNDLARYPYTDYWGNSTDGTGYQSSSLVYTGQIYVPTQVTQSYDGSLAAWNAADNAGKRIRTQTAIGPIAIYCIGYTGTDGVDTALLKRLANTTDSSSYQPTEQTGMVLLVRTADQLTSAFNAVASDLLRLAQ